MRKLTFMAVIVVAAFAIGTTGCPGKKTTATGAGGSGTGTGAGGTGTGGGGAAATGDDSFTLAHNAKDSQDIKQGDTAKIKISVTRQKNYKQGDDPIKITAKVTKGDVTVDPASEDLKADQNNYELKITAKGDAKADAAYEVTVTAAGPHDKGGKLTITGKTTAK